MSELWFLAGSLLFLSVMLAVVDGRHSIKKLIQKNENLYRQIDDLKRELGEVKRDTGRAAIVRFRC